MKNLFLKPEIKKPKKSIKKVDSYIKNKTLDISEIIPKSNTKLDIFKINWEEMRHEEEKYVMYKNTVLLEEILPIPNSTSEYEWRDWIHKFSDLVIYESNVTRMSQDKIFSILRYVNIKESQINKELLFKLIEEVSMSYNHYLKFAELKYHLKDDIIPRKLGIPPEILKKLFFERKSVFNIKNFNKKIFLANQSMLASKLNLNNNIIYEINYIWNTIVDKYEKIN